MVKFTVNLAADDDPDVYEAFIIDLRNRLAVGDRIENIPILESDGHIDFFDVMLSYTDGSTTQTIQVRFRTDNLYLIGYRPQSSTIWYELRHEDSTSHLINEPGTTTQILSFGENYNDLVETAGMGLDEVPLSSSRIGGAITTLALDTTDPGRRARALLTLIFAISEAARLRDISSLVTRSWWSESTPGTQFANRVRSWARLSSAVQRTRNEGHLFDFDGQSTGIWSFVEAILALGIMHLAHSYSNARPERSISDMGSNTSYAQGQPLLEIFRVRINDIDGEDPGQLYGTIKVTDSAGTAGIWRIYPDETPLEISPGDDIVLAGPSRPLYAADELYISLELWDHDIISPDDLIAKGTIAFNPLDFYTDYDLFHDCLVSGDYGSVSVSYMAMADGLYAEVNVILIDGDGEDPADVYGTLIANNGSGDSTLFRKTKDERIQVSPDDQIPLWRSIVAVPVYSTLRITADLWDYDTIGSDDPIAQGSVAFKPTYNKPQTDYISGQYGKIEVQVSWK